MKIPASMLAVVFTAICLILIFQWNWGLALFLASITPLVYGTARLVRNPAPDSMDTFLLLAGGTLLAYAFSPGPFVGCGQLYYQVTGSSGFWSEAFSWIYSPHIALCTGRFGSAQFNTGFWNYIIQWQLLCSLT